MSLSESTSGEYIMTQYTIICKRKIQYSKRTKGEMLHELHNYFHARNSLAPDILFKQPISDSDILELYIKHIVPTNKYP